LTVLDNGSGCKKIPADSKGMGHHIMSHRAKMMGGSLDIQSRSPHGMAVTCMFPVRSAEQ
jgi:signal transduction histidine kinase